MPSQGARSTGGRPLTGRPRWNPKRNRWEARLQIPGPDGIAHEKTIEIPKLGKEDGEQARKIARSLATKARDGGAVLADTPETFSEWVERYCEWKEARGVSTHKDIKARLVNWTAPILGTKPMREGGILRAEVEAVVRKLDEAIEERTRWYEEHDEEEERKGRKPGLASKTAANIWGDLCTAFDEAVNSKDPSLRMLSTNPTKDVRAPEATPARSQPVLYPGELLQLVECSLVPIHWRRMYAGAMYLVARSNELAAITSADVDVIHRTTSINKQIDRDTGETKPTKTKQARVIDVPNELWPLIEYLLSVTPSGQALFRMPPDEDRAEMLRRHLLLAGVTRPELFADDAMRAPVRFHNLRISGLVMQAKRGDHPLELQRQSGHTNSKTLDHYIQWARKLPSAYGMPFPTLPSALWDAPKALFSAPNVSGIVSGFQGSNEEISMQNNEQTLRSQRELNLLENGSDASLSEKESSQKQDTPENADELKLASVSGFSQHSEPGSKPQVDAVEEALTGALTEAAKAGRFDVVAQLAKELEARRLARSTNVVSITSLKKGGQK